MRMQRQGGLASIPMGFTKSTLDVLTESSAEPVMC